MFGHVPIVSFLLSQSDVNVNHKNEQGHTAFLLACSNGNSDCVKLLLKDYRVDINQTDDRGSGPLWLAVMNNQLEVVKLCLASVRNRDLDLGSAQWLKLERELEWKRHYLDVIAASKNIPPWQDKVKKSEIAGLLESFRDHPDQTRHRLRLEFGELDEIAATLFALLIFLCDETT